MKKTLALVVASTILGSVLMTGCAGSKDKKSEENGTNKIAAEFPLKEKVKYSVVQARSDAYKPFQSLTEWNEQFEKKSNIQIDWLDWGTGDAYKQKLKLAFASGDLPDAFYGGYILNTADYVNYGSQGFLIPLEKMIKDNMPNFNKLVARKAELTKEMTAPDGHMYGLPAYNENGATMTNDTLLYNKTWLDKLGMKVPTTTDEFYQYLKAVKEANDINGNGKNDEIPFTFRFGTNGAIEHINGISSFVGFSGTVLPQSYFVVRDGKIVFAPGQPEIKDAVKYLNKLASEGLIDKEAFTMDSNAYNAKVKSKQPMVGATTAWSTVQLNSAIGSEVFVYGPPLKGSNGQQSWAKRVTPVYFDIAFAITNKAKNPELLLKWADLHYDYDTSVQNFYGPYDKYIKKLGNNQFEEILKPDGKQYMQNEKSADTPQNFSLYILLKDDVQFNTVSDSSKAKLEADKIYAPYFDKAIYNANGFFTPEESQRNTVVQTDVGQYVTKMMAKWIYSGGVDEDWNEYLSQLKKLGLDDWVKNAQAAYDRTK